MATIRRIQRMRRFWLVLVIAGLVIAACGAAAPQMSASDAGQVAPAVEYVEVERVVAEQAAEEPFAVADTSSGASTQVVGQERLIIRTGNLTIVVTDPEASLRDLSRLAESNGGWVVSSNIYQYNSEAKQGDLTMRVPAEMFDSVLNQVQAMAVEVRSQSTSGQDVTEEFVDLEARLANLEATAARVRSFLASAEDVEDALAVNRELTRLEGDIEVIKGRMQYLSQSAAFSTISVRLLPDILAQPIEIGGWRPVGVARDAILALVNALQSLATVAIWLVIYLVPLVLLAVVPLALIVRWVWRRRRGGTAVTQPTSQ